MSSNMRSFLGLITLLHGISAFERGSLCVFKVDVNEKQKIFKTLETEENFTLVFVITPTTSIFKYNGKGTLTNVIQRMMDSYKKQIIAAEPVMIQKHSTKLEGISSYVNTSNKHIPDLTNRSNYGMGIEETWSQGYTGMGVTIATVDVGVDTDLLDLKRNIKKEWSYNFVQNNTDVSAEHFYHEPPRILQYTDHGDKVASILGAVKGNSSAGISYNAAIVVLKVFEFILSDINLSLNPTHWTASDITARALVYKLDDIDILVMAWSFVSPVQRLDLATREALTYGAKTGRRGLGRVYVVAAGPSGNELTNNIYTITVNGIGKEGVVPKYTYGDTSVLVSGLSDGNNLTSTYMITTTVGNNFTARFNGVSAATSQVSGIIGLALQANPFLTLREIQHLLVQSAEYNGLDETYAFHRNGAGRYYHRNFGFGLLNAKKLVTLAKTRRVLTELLTVTLEHIAKSISDDGHSHEYKFCHSCNNLSKQPCLTVIEHVAVSFEFETFTGLKMDLTSPSGTRSVLMRGTKDWTLITSGQLISVNFWDESAFGEWKFSLISRHSLRNSSSQTNVTKISMTLYGTNTIQTNSKSHRCGVNVEYKYNKKNRLIQEYNFSNELGADQFIYLGVIFFSFLLLGSAVAWQCKKMYRIKLRDEFNKSKRLEKNKKTHSSTEMTTYETNDVTSVRTPTST